MKDKDDYCFFRNCDPNDYGLLVAIICGIECEYHNTEMCPYYKK